MKDMAHRQPHAHRTNPYPHPASIWYHVAEFVVALACIGVLGFALFVWLPA